MRHFLMGITLAMLAGMVLTSSASAVTIYDVKATKMPGDPYDWTGKYGLDGYSLMWSSTASGKFDIGGHPTGNYTAGSWKNNPPWLNFQTGLTGTSGSGTYTPTDAISGNVTPRFYTLKSNSGGHQFDFSVYFFDPDLSEALVSNGENGASVTLVGDFGTVAGDPIKSDPNVHVFNSKAINGQQIREGTMVTFNIGVSEAENVSVTIETKNTYAAGFFMDNVQDGWAPASLSNPPLPTHMPEPATMALLALGLGGLLRRRFRK